MAGLQLESIHELAEGTGKVAQFPCAGADARGSFGGFAGGLGDAVDIA